MTKNCETGSEILVMLSGGLDSAACLHFYKEMGRKVSALHINYGQKAAEKELVSAKAITTYYGVSLLKSKWSGLKGKECGLINGRNAFLIAGALMEAPETITTIAVGIHGGTQYPDCDNEFLSRMQGVINIYGGNRISLAAPFLDWAKADIWEYANSNNVPVQLTWSCEAGGVRPCGYCLSCRDREVLNVAAQQNLKP